MRLKVVLKCHMDEHPLELILQYADGHSPAEVDHWQTLLPVDLHLPVLNLRKNISTNNFTKILFFLEKKKSQNSFKENATNKKQKLIISSKEKKFYSLYLNIICAWIRLTDLYFYFSRIFYLCFINLFFWRDYT